MEKRTPGLWLSILLITVISALAFLPFINQLGFYFNDWHPLSGEVAGVSAYSLFKLERPGVGYLYDLTYPILGPHPLAWQLFTFALRLGGVICFLLILRRLWPERGLETGLAALLMAIYPGFMQQPIALTFSNHFITQGAALLSIFFTVLSLQSGKRWQKVLCILAALVLELSYLFVYEYMLGFEILRLLLIGLLIRRRNRIRFWPLVGQTLLNYLPYLLPLAVFLAWRLFSFVSSRPTTDLRVLTAAYQANPVGMFGRLVLETVWDALQTAFLAWGVPLVKSFQRIPGWLAALSVGLGLLSGALTWFYFRGPKSDGQPKDFTTEWLWVGGIGLLAAVFPVVLSNREVRFDSLMDRYTLHAAACACLFLAGLIFRVFRPALARWVIIFLTASAVTAMVANTNGYIQRWQAQRQTWWQLSWRAPQLKPDTALVAVLPAGLRLMEGSEVWTPANWIYYPGAGSLYLTGEVLDQVSLQNIQSRADAPRNFRNILFTNKFDQMLLISLPSLQSCLHVLDGQQVETSGQEDALTLQPAPYSVISQVMVDKDPVNMPPLFGREPAHGWCYDYQKASLARQQGDWEEVARLGDEAQAKGYSPKDLSEWLPFIEGYLNVGRFEDALKLSQQVKSNETARQTICQNLLASRSPAGGFSNDTVFRSLVGNLCSQ